MASYATDPVALLQALIRCPSVTPVDEGALGVLEDALTPLGSGVRSEEVHLKLNFKLEPDGPMASVEPEVGKTLMRPVAAEVTANLLPSGETNQRLP